MQVPGYRIREELSRDEICLIARAERLDDGAAVILKAPLSPSPATIAARRREHDLLEGLDVKGAARPSGFDASSGTLVFPDTGTVPLRTLVGSTELDARGLLVLARQLAETLAGIHRRRIVHRGLNPDSVFVDPATRRPVVLDFGAASRLPEEASGSGAPGAVGDRLAYAAPEQSGRMNRLVDQRTDLYSLGALLYALLTGGPPFVSQDPLELVHWQIARVPPSPSELRPGVPRVLSEIVMKLLAKTAEDRYQTAAGLAEDLRRCAEDWAALGALAPFPLGERDVPDRFTIPQRLYGREGEVDRLLRAFERACGGPSVLILVAGYSGVGKTSLVNEVHKPIVRERGRFVSGKFDQLERNVPYGALLQSLRRLLQLVLGESEERIAGLRARLRESLGANAGVVSAVLPELELLLGPQPAPRPLPPAESQNRFNQAFAGFLACFARPEQPLVIFLDDLQWADSATLRLLALLLGDPGVGHLLLIGAYRDNEVTPDHPLAKLAVSLRGSGCAVEEISLPPLGLPHVAELAQGALRLEREEVLDLARLVLRKTDGNPFFVTQFLRSLAADGLIEFDDARRAWRFDLPRIEEARITENVVDLMTRKLRKLGPPSQVTLTLAACIGNVFSLSTLGVIRQRGPRELAADLWEAVEAGLVVPTDDGFETLIGAPDEVLAGAQLSFRFLHDRVQQAAYALIPDDQKKPVHLRAGQLLLAECGEPVPENRIFEIVSHLNLGQELLPDEGARRSLAELNLAAGRKAKASAAFQAALGHFEAGRALLREDSWSSDHGLAFALHLEAAECQSLCGLFDAAELSFDRLLRRARARVEKARVYTLRLLQYEGLSRYADAIRIGREALSLFGVSFPDALEERRAALDTELRTIDGLLGGRPIESLVDLPAMDDPETRMVMKLLTNLHTSCFLSGDKLLTLLNAATMVRLSLAHGNCEESAYAYVLHAAMLLVPLREDFAAAYEFGALAMRLNERFPAPALRAKVLMNFAWAVSLFRRPMQESVPITHEAFRLGNENGLYVEASYALFNECWFALLCGPDLASFERTAAANVGYVERVKMSHFVAAPQTVLQWGRALMGRTAAPTSLTDSSFDEARFEEGYAGESLFQMFYLDAKLALLYTFGDCRGACRVARRAEEVIRQFTGTIWDELRVFYHAASLAALHREGDADERREAEGLLPGLEGRLERWAESSPRNFRAHHRIVAAERARIEGRTADAIAGYEAALEAAGDQDCPRERALALELYGRFWQDRGQAGAAGAFLSASRDAWAKWGAAAKVEDLERRHPELLGRAPGHGAPALDFLSAMKAAHAISREIELERLLRTLVRIAIQNAGAERGLLLQERDGRLHLAAEGSLGSEGSVISPEAPVEGRMDLCHSIVNLAQRTGESVLVDDATRDARFEADAYVQARRPKSVLCVPVIHQGRRTGLLYLENNLAPQAFTAERIQMMQILSAQAAIALENARLYTELEALKDRLQAENVYLQEEIRTQHNFEEIVGNSPALLEVLRKVERVAPTDATVLVYGETGTGKELFARAIHNRSRRRDRPLVKVNCGAIPPGLVESELFGHVRGAFTGALQNRTGRFELADRGTVFMDEVSELPAETQVKLLRVLQEQEFEPVGSSRTQRVDVRVIAASNRRLDEAVRAGRFRSDLLYRLNVFPVDVPPLRERRSDVPLLVAFFVSRLAKKLGKPLEGASRRTMERLMSYSWPGNVRELQNVVERAAILARGPLLEIDGDFLTSSPTRDSPSSSLEDMERHHIKGVLRQTRGVIEGPRGAAAVLGVHPNTLRSRMKKLGVERLPNESA